MCNTKFCGETEAAINKSSVKRCPEKNSAEPLRGTDEGAMQHICLPNRFSPQIPCMIILGF